MVSLDWLPLENQSTIHQIMDSKRLGRCGNRIDIRYQFDRRDQYQYPFDSWKEGNIEVTL